MKKKLLSLTLTLIMIIFMGVLPACSQPDNDPNDGSTPESGGGAITTPSDEPVLYDLRVASYKEEAERSNEVIAMNGCKVIWLPDGKTVVVDPWFHDREDMRFKSFYSEFTHDLKVETDNYSYYRHVIDYLVITNEAWVSFDVEKFFRNFTVKNYYRPDIEVDFDYWNYEMHCLREYEDSYHVAEEDVKSINPTHLEGRKRKYFEECYNFDADGNTILEYQYNSDYIYSLYFAEQQGTNIQKITNNTKITNTIEKDGQSYTYSLDFWVPEAVVDDIGWEFGYIEKDNNIIDEYMTNYNQSAEYGCAFSLEYGDFGLIYLDKPTKNILKSFLINYDRTKKFDVWLGDSVWFPRLSAINYFDLYIKAFTEYESEYEDEYVISNWFDADKAATNYIIVNMLDVDAKNHWFKNGSMTWIDYNLFGYSQDVDPVFTKENIIIPRNADWDDRAMPIINVQKTGEHTLIIRSESPGFSQLLTPTIDGVALPPG